MKKSPFQPFLFAAFLLFAVSCKRDDMLPVSNTRNIKFVLYTNEDFSTDNKNITFSVFARDGRKTILDSPLVTMKISNIPGMANKIVIEKNIQAHPDSTLTVGFTYQIENVGSSWFLDTCRGKTKTIEYAFR